MALVNAIYALNGSYIPPERLARFSAARGHYFYNAGTADTLYPDVAEKWGKKYRFKYDGLTGSFAELQKHLRKGGTAVALVPGHYLAIAKYRSSDGKYLILDSAVGGRRPTSINGDWMSMGQLQSGALFCQHFHLFSAVKGVKEPFLILYNCCIYIIFIKPHLHLHGSRIICQLDMTEVIKEK